MGWITATALFLQISVQMGTPILFGTLGGILGEKTGNLNLGVEGMMIMGAAVGFKVALVTANPWLAVLAAGIAGALGALIYCIVTVTFKGNQTVTGLALTIFGTGFAGMLGKSMSGVSLPQPVLDTFAAYDVNLIWGVAYDESMQDEMQVTVIATGFDNDKNFDIPAYTFKSPAKSAAAPAPRQEEAKEVQDDDDDNGFIDIMEIFRSKK